MKQIRNGFETNSSSSHSLTISGTGAIQTIVPDEHGIVMVFGGEYGWGYDELHYPSDKLSYLAQDLWCESEEKFLALPEIKMLREVIESQTGGKLVFDFESLQCGYVDHQSSGTSAEAFESEDKLYRFLFYRDSVVIIDNDNH